MFPGVRSRAAGIALGLAAALCACAVGPEPIHVTSVRLAREAPTASLGETGLDRAGVEDAARTALATNGFRLGEGKRPHAAGVDVTAVRVVGGASGPRAEVAVEVVLTPAVAGSAPPRRELAIASVPFASATAPGEAWRRALAGAVQGAAEALALGVRAEGKGVQGLVADLSAKDVRVREHAVRILGERRSREAVPALLDRLGQEEPRLGHRIVGALAQIGDERAVPALIDLSRGTDSGLTSRVLRFVGDIGGAEAEGYLLTLASGHPDPRVRVAAREALDELAARSRNAPVAARR